MKKPNWVISFFCIECTFFLYLVFTSAVTSHFMTWAKGAELNNVNRGNKVSGISSSANKAASYLFPGCYEPILDDINTCGTFRYDFWCVCGVSLSEELGGATCYNRKRVALWLIPPLPNLTKPEMGYGTLWLSCLDPWGRPTCEGSASEPPMSWKAKFNVTCGTSTPTPTPTATPAPTPQANCDAFLEDIYTSCEPRNNGLCRPGPRWTPVGPFCCCYKPVSPLLIDLDGNGFQFTDAANGVWFDFDGSGVPIKAGWTVASSLDGWLVLDRNGNGVIDNGLEMFGNSTQQDGDPNNIPPNGFIALRWFDDPVHDGNGDGVIDSWDTTGDIYNRLRIWVDANHNGISEANELKTMQAAGVESIDLNYYASALTDQWGNKFKYKSQVWKFGWKTICDVYPTVVIN